MISVVWLIVFNTSMKPLVTCQPLGKFGLFTFVVSHSMCSILSKCLNVNFCKWGEPKLWILVEEHKTGEGQFSKGYQIRKKLWYRGNEVLIN